MGWCLLVVVFLVVIFLVRLVAVTDPQTDDHARADSDEKADEALCNRTDPTEGEAARVVRLLDAVLDVRDDVVDVGLRQCAGTEERHASRTGLDGFGNLGRGHRVERWRRVPVRDRVTGSSDCVTGRAVEGVEIEAPRLI